MKRRSGWALLETLCALFLCSVLAMGAFHYISHVKAQYLFQQQLIELEQSAYSALDFLEKDLRQLNFFADWTDQPLHLHHNLRDETHLLSLLCRGFSANDFLLMTYGSTHDSRCLISSASISLIRLMPISRYDPDHFYACLSHDQISLGNKEQKKNVHREVSSGAGCIVALMLRKENSKEKYCSKIGEYVAKLFLRALKPCSFGMGWIKIRIKLWINM